VRKTNVDIVTNIKTTIRVLQTENRPLYGFLDLYRIAWPRQARKNKKIYRSLIIKIATSSQANRIINDGVSIESEIKICELFARKYRFIQYINCHQYRYIAPKYRGVIRCGHYARLYFIKNCDFQGIGPPIQRYNVCGTQGYIAWLDNYSFR
jgi:hypothetical protein